MSEPTTLTLDSAARKDIPLARGVLDYFPAALAEVAMLSKAGNDKHSPGEEMHHARGKSTDHADCIMRHLMERGTVDTDGFLHEVKVAWRALALLQEALEQRGAPLARGAKLPNADARPTQGSAFDFGSLEKQMLSGAQWPHSQPQWPGIPGLQPSGNPDYKWRFGGNF